jgi:hypothetical protein
MRECPFELTDEIMTIALDNLTKDNDINPCQSNNEIEGKCRAEIITVCNARKLFQHYLLWCPEDECGQMVEPESFDIEVGSMRSALRETYLWFKSYPDYRNRKTDLYEWLGRVINECLVVLFRRDVEPLVEKHQWFKHYLKIKLRNMDEAIAIPRGNEDDDG